MIIRDELVGMCREQRPVLARNAKQWEDLVSRVARIRASKSGKKIPKQSKVAMLPYARLRRL